jgi:ribosomal protein S18 acetylase RimI-like enzyme
MYLPEYTPDAHGAPLADVVVRLATDADLPACAALLTLRDGGTLGDWLDRLRFHLAAGEQLFVADLFGVVVGYARLSWQSPVTNGGRNLPEGHYLSGMIVDPRYRRRGIGRGLTRARIAWSRARGERAFFVVNATNRASMDLHREVGFRELTRDFDFPGITFTGGDGVLFGADASGEWQNVTELGVGAAR